MLWATNFASVLESHFVEPVREVLRTVGREMDLSRKDSHLTPTYQKCSYHRPGEPCVVSDVGEMMVILKPPWWEMDTESVGGTNWLSQYLQSLCFWPFRSVALDASH